MATETTMPAAQPRKVLVGGGARSGKSTYALRLARRLGEDRYLIATAQALDVEMEQRIALHRKERGADFVTVEEPLEVVAALDRLPPRSVVVVDCVTLWLSNLLLRGDSDEQVEEQAVALSAAFHRSQSHVIVVTNEVGMGVVPPTSLGRRFRDACGRAHQRLAGRADEVHFAVLGLILRLKPAPVEAQSLEIET